MRALSARGSLALHFPIPRSVLTRDSERITRAAGAGGDGDSPLVILAPRQRRANLLLIRPRRGAARDRRLHACLEQRDVEFQRARPCQRGRGWTAVVDRDGDDAARIFARAVAARP